MKDNHLNINNTDYREVFFPGLKEKRNEISEIITATLADAGFESFQEDESGLRAYIPENQYNSEAFNDLACLWESFPGLEPQHRIIPRENWNALWESNFPPLLIDHRCYIRAPFHPENQETEYQIVIEPKMSFGTGHHETTELMCKALLNLDLKNASVLDMGCGTGILSILASMRGAAEVLAIDIDAWACENTLENKERNKIKNIKVLQGDVSLLTGKTFDAILANINRNILLEDMAAYVNSLNPEGILLLSGIYDTDVATVRKKAASLGLTWLETKKKNQWARACFQKNQSELLVTNNSR